MPTNFKTYEAQSRLLVAVLASNPDLKLNFKEIAKYFGESTHMGIEFQFRSIKKEAKSLRAAADNGESPVKARGVSSTPTSGTKRKKNVFATPSGTPSGSPAKRQKKVAANAGNNIVDMTCDDDDEDCVEMKLDPDQQDNTPTRPRKKKTAAVSQPTAAAPPAYAAPTPALTTAEGTPSEEDDGANLPDLSQVSAGVDALPASFSEYGASLKNEPGEWDLPFGMGSHRQMDGPQFSFDEDGVA